MYLGSVCDAISRHAIICTQNYRFAAVADIFVGFLCGSWGGQASLYGKCNVGIAARASSQLFDDATLPVFLFRNTKWLSFLLSVLANVLTPSRHKLYAPLELIASPVRCLSFILDSVRQC